MKLIALGIIVEDYNITIKTSRAPSIFDMEYSKIEEHKFTKDHLYTAVRKAVECLSEVNKNNDRSFPNVTINAKTATCNSIEAIIVLHDYIMKTLTERSNRRVMYYILDNTIHYY